MAGGYISCGDFCGDDKSASALSGVVEDLKAMLRWENEPKLLELMENITAFVTGEAVPPDDWEEEIIIRPDQMGSLLPHLKKYQDKLINQTVTSDPLEAIDREQESTSVDPTDLKWGEGIGWRLYCVADLMRAAEHSIKTGDEVSITFD